MIRLLVVLMCTLLLGACVSSKKYAELENSYEQLQDEQAIKKSVNAADEQKVEQLAEQIRMKDDQIANYEKKVREFEMYDDAGDMEEPTPEQWEAYTLLHEKQIRELEESGNAEMETELNRVYSTTAYNNHKLIQSIESVLKNYKESEVSYEENHGYTTVKFSDSFLYDSKGERFTSQGKEALDKIILAIGFQPSAHYNIYGVVDSWSTENVETRSKQSEKVYAHMLKEAKHQPSYFAVSWCKDLIGGSNDDCKSIHIQFGFDQQHLSILLEEAILK